ncbi:MAG: hypothetical protein KA213_04105 [Flavobacterium sp.]|nr:hypothetical protein [Flavobacterium sp.]
MRISEISGVSFWFGSGERSIYGMETFESYTLLSLFISSLIIFKGITGFGMWTEKDWAIKFGIIDASIGILICVIMTITEPVFQNIDGKSNINLRFELLFLVPYLIKCFKLREDWEQFDYLGSKKRTTIVPKETTETIIPQKEEPQKIVEQTIDKEDHSRFMPKG